MRPFDRELSLPRVHVAKRVLLMLLAGRCATLPGSITIVKDAFGAGMPLSRQWYASMQRIALRVACSELECALCVVTGLTLTALGLISGRMLRAIYFTYSNDLGLYRHLNLKARGEWQLRRFLAHFYDSFLAHTVLDCACY